MKKDENAVARNGSCTTLLTPDEKRRLKEEEKRSGKRLLELEIRTIF